ncbi:MAG TPA: hypothetical protein VL528_03375 [Oxalicibacterium sp.]|jgi:hypothetical protein|nr:hypothetical protein [Oxalicibacterium sp.]
MSAAPVAVERPQTNADYQQLLARFDRLWASASSPQDQREMQQLLILINQHEASGAARRQALPFDDSPLAAPVSPNP